MIKRYWLKVNGSSKDITVVKTRPGKLPAHVEVFELEIDYPDPPKRGTVAGRIELEMPAPAQPVVKVTGGPKRPTKPLGQVGGGTP